jgi:uncharacterized protein DUF1592/uncharacterized protein DUF1595/uncharacterized protein DUF1587/cytochrome c
MKSSLPLRVILAWCLALSSGLGYLSVTAQVSPVSPVNAGNRIALPSPTQGDSADISLRPLLNRYCLNCHNGRLKTAGLTLDDVDLEHVSDSAEVLEKVLQKLRTQEMPPPGLPHPDAAAYNAAASWLETALDSAAEAKAEPGRVPLHRLNRAEYANAIRDVLDFEIIDNGLLPPADAIDQEGFDNIASSLSLSPALTERYVALARSISVLAVGDPAARPKIDRYQIRPTLNQKGRMSDDLPFESRGGMAIRHYFPVDGEYTIKIRLFKEIYSYVVGIGFPHQLDVRVDGKRVKLFTVGGEAPGTPPPATLVGNILTDPEWEAYMHAADEHLDVRLPIQAGIHAIGVSFLDSLVEVEGVLQKPQTGTDYNSSRDEHYDGYPSVDSVEIGGPFKINGVGDTASRRRIFVCHPSSSKEEEPCARNILASLARRAYRRPVSIPDIQPLMTFYQAGRSAGNFDAGIQRAIERMLADPEFLFRAEHDAAKSMAPAPQTISDLELASRVSFFLWSSIPDDTLMDVASRGGLRNSAMLVQQIRRMLADRRSQALVDNFAGQWLKTRDLAGVTPDPDLFPQFTDNLRNAFRQETGELHFREPGSR